MFSRTKLRRQSNSEIDRERSRLHHKTLDGDRRRRACSESEAREQELGGQWWQQYSDDGIVFRNASFDSEDSKDILLPLSAGVASKKPPSEGTVTNRFEVTAVPAEREMTSFDVDNSSCTELSQAEKNRLACKRFRMKRKRDIQNVVERNNQLEQEIFFLLQRILQLQHELDSFGSQLFRDEQLRSENRLLKVQLHSTKAFMEQILAAQIQPPDVRSIDTLRVLSVEAHKAAQRFLSIAAQSAGLLNCDWVNKTPPQQRESLGQIKYSVQNLLSVSGISLTRTRVTTRVDLKDVPVEPDMVYHRLWLSFHPEPFVSHDNVQGARTHDSHGNSLIIASLKKDQLDVEHELLRFGLGTECTGTAVKLCVQTSIPPPLFDDDSKNSDPDENSRLMCARNCLNGALIRPSGSNSQHSDITIIESIPIEESWAYRPSVLDEKDELNSDYLEHLSRVIHHGT